MSEHRHFESWGKGVNVEGPQEITPEQIERLDKIARRAVAMATNTPEEDALEAWAQSDERTIRPDAVVQEGTPQNRRLMRSMLDAAGRREYQWLNHPDDIAEARRRRALKRSGLFGWLKVTLTRQRIPQRPPRSSLDHKMNRTGGPEQVLTKAQWNIIAKHYGAERI